MRILYVNSLYPPTIGGGAELSLAMLAQGQQAQGREVMVATTTAPGPVRHDTIDGVPVTRLPIANVYWHHGPERPGPLKRLAWHARDMDNGAMARRLSQVVGSFRPDVMSFHNLAGLSASAWGVARSHGIPSVQVLHDYYNLCSRSQMFRDLATCESPCTQCRAFRIGRAAKSNRVDAVVGASQSILDTHLRNGLFAEVDVRRVIHNARAFQAAPRDAYPSRAKTFGFIGTLSPWKGIDRVLEAFMRLVARVPDLRFVVAGEGDESFVSALHMRFDAPQVVFLGKVPAPAFFAGIDALVVPSLWNDPLPGVVFESMIFGVPIIGARRGGIPEMVSDGVDGFLFEPDRPEELDGFMGRLASDDGLAERMGRAAFAASAPYVDTRRVIDAYFALYETVLERGPAQATAAGPRTAVGSP